MQNDVANTEGMQARLEELKEVKFLIPVRHHVNLHSWKLLQNKSISGTVTAALEAYFTQHNLELDRERGEPAE